MTAKDEFYALISQSFTNNEVSIIKVVVDGIEKQIDASVDENNRDNEFRALYLDCCSLYYSSAKDFNNFKANLTNRQLLLDYTKFVLSVQDNAEMRKMSCYNNTHNIVSTFIKQSTNWTQIENLDTDSLALAITNAIVPEILAQEDCAKAIVFYQNVKEMQKLSSLISKGKKITRIGFDLDNTNSVCVIRDQTCISNFYNDLVKFSSYRMHLPDDIDDEITRLDSQTRHSVNRITYRICMVLVHYRILKVITASKKYILRDENGNHISLEQGIMTLVRKLLDVLGQKMKERENEYGSTTNTKSIAEKIKNLLRAGKKELGDSFSFNDISDNFWGCFMKGHKTEEPVLRR